MPVVALEAESAHLDVGDFDAGGVPAWVVADSDGGAGLGGGSRDELLLTNDRKLGNTSVDAEECCNLDVGNHHSSQSRHCDPAIGCGTQSHWFPHDKRSTRRPTQLHVNRDQSAPTVTSGPTVSTNEQQPIATHSRARRRSILWYSLIIVSGAPSLP